MFSTKVDVDRHVKDIFNKLNTDNERDAKCYMLAKLYYKVKDYESAIKYVNRYIINVRSTAQAQRFLGECYEATKQPSKALEAYRASLELDGGQRDLVLKVGELLSDPELPLVISVASYWLDRLCGLFPKHPIVFKLRERLLRANPEAKKDPKELESLILSEIMARPNAPEVRIRFLDFLIDTDNAKTAMKQAAELIPLGMFPDHLPWFDCLHRVTLAYENSNPELTMNDLLIKLTILERRCTLSLQDFGVNKRSNVECALVVFDYDQGLHTVSKQYTPKKSEKLFFDSALSHFRAQLAYHLAVLKLRRAKSEPNTWQRAVKISSPLLAIATKPTDVVEREETKLTALWRAQAALRVSVSSHVLRAWANGSERFLEEVYKSCGGKWRERTYENIFHNKEYLDAMVTSDFINESLFLDLPMSIPSYEDLERIDRDAQSAHPASLHHLVWLGLANSIPSNHIKPSFHCNLFPNLPWTVNEIENTSPDSLNRLDVDTFLYAAVYCAKKEGRLIPSGERPKLLPVSIADDLCNLHQAEWWSLVNKFTSSKSSAMLNNDQRLRLRKGIETVRALGLHGLHPKLLYHVAYQLQLIYDSSDDDEVLVAVGSRVEMLWKAVIPLLERLKKGQPVRESGSKLFDYGSTDWTMKEIHAALEDSKKFLALLLLKANNHLEALDILLELSSSEALYYQAVIYKTLAEESMKTGPTAASRQDTERLLRKARSILETTDGILKKPVQVGARHSNQSSAQLIDEINCLLAECNPHSYGTEPYAGQKMTNKPVERILVENILTSTPRLVRSPTTVENLNQSANFNHEARSNGSNNDSITEQLKFLRSDVGDLKSLLQEFLAEFKKVSYKLVERQEMEDILNAEEFAAEDAYDEDAPSYYNEPNVQRTAQPVQPVVPPFPYGTLQQYMPGLVWPGSLPFSEGQHLPDFRSLQNGPPVGLPLAPPINIPPPELLPASNAAATTDVRMKIVPNVVVTTSVTLPTYTRMPQPPMAVTIPPEHVRGGHRSQDTHAFQISLANAQHLSSPVTVQSPSDKYQARVYEQSPLSFSSNTPKVTFDTPSDKNKSGAFSTPPATNPIQNPVTKPKSGIFDADAELSMNHQKPVPDWTPIKYSIIPDESQNKARIVIRDASGKTLIDTDLSSKVVLSRLSDTMLSWSAADFGYGDSLIQKFLIRFKTLELSKNFELEFKKFVKDQPSVPASTAPKSVIAPPIFTFSKTPATPAGTTTPTTKIDALADTEKSVFGNKVSPGFNFTSLAQTGQVANAFASSTEFKGFAGMGSPLFASKSNENQKNESVEQDDSAGEEKEYEPNVEFTPVIPLPDLVEVKTGEEEEEKVYEERAKILKFSSETKEWKEKGRGNVKLLRHPETGKVRIVMRRDQVHKVCCNHFLDDTMKFQRMTSSDRAATWTAQDFSGGELSPELLAIQFSKPDILNDFLKKIEDLQKEMREGSSKKPTEKKLKSTSETQKPLSEMFKKTPGSWECGQCLVLNKPDVYKCIACETKRPGDFGPVAAQTTTPEKCAFTFGIPAGTTETTPGKKSVSFGFSNDAGKFTFGSGSTAPAPSQFSFAASFAPSAQPFSFGINPTTTQSPFKIGSSETFNFKFNKSLDETKTSEADDEDKSEDEANDVENEDDNLTFKPVIPLPEKVPLHTGEEDEDVVYVHRAKLFRFHDKEWKERGLGDIKILKHKETKKVRLLMRREQVFKICLNHYLLKDMHFSAKDGKSWIWSATDFSDGSVSNELFCIRFRDETIAGNFKQAIDREQETLISSPQALKAAETIERDSNSAVRSLFTDDDVEQVYEYVASAEDQAEAKRLQLPPNFYRYKEAKPCPGCSGCEPDDESKPQETSQESASEDDKFDVVIPKTVAEVTPVKTGSEETPGLLPKPATIFAKAATEQLTEKTETEDKAKNSVFANFSFKSAFDAPATAPTTTSFFGSASGSIFGSKPTTEFPKTPIFGGSVFNTQSSIFGGAGGLNDPDKPVFNADSNLSFASLSKNATTFGTSNAPTWDTTIKPINNQPQQKRNEVKSDESDNEGTDDDANDSYDPEYKPIIDLPEAIEVKTGEEDETTLFCERVKLYRFDKEWKERGIGEIKILHNPQHGSYRILMRREVVLKTVCNMRISSHFELLPMSKARNAWVWYGKNYVDDDGPQDEKLAVKFKTEESAGKFKDVIDGCLEKLADVSRGDEYEGDDGEEGSYCEEMTLVKNDVSLSVFDEDSRGFEKQASDVVLRIYESRSREMELCFGDGEQVISVHSNPAQDEYSKIEDHSILLKCFGDEECRYLIEFSNDEDANDTYEHLLSLQADGNQE